MGAPALGLSEKQLDLRRTGVGASEVAAVIGVHPTKSAIDVWMAKQPDAPESDGGSLAEFGHRVERILGEAWVDRHGAEGLRIYTPGTLRHPTHDWALASPDRVVATPGLGRPARADWKSLLEMKAAFFSDREYGDGADEVPERHLVQVAWQLAVTGLEEGTLVALVRGDYREYPITRDRELEELLLDQVGRFWREHVLAGVPPAVDGSDGWAGYLRRRYPRDAAPLLPATPEALDLAAKLKEAKAAAKAAGVLEEQLSQALKLAIGDAAGIEGVASWKANRDGQKTDWEATARQLFARLAGPMNQQLLDEVIAANTTHKPGARVLRLLGGTT